MFSDLLDLSAFTNTSEEVIFGFDNYALQIQDLDPDYFNGQTFTVNLGSAEEALQSNGNLGESLNTSQTVLNILVNQTTSSVMLSQNFFSGSMNSSVKNASNSINEASFIPQNPVEVSFRTVDMVINFNSFRNNLLCSLRFHTCS